MAAGIFIILANVKGVARRKENSQSEANKGRYPPLPLPSCSPRIFGMLKIAYCEEYSAIAKHKLLVDRGCPFCVYRATDMDGDQWLLQSYQSQGNLQFLQGCESCSLRIAHLVRRDAV